MTGAQSSERVTLAPERAAFEAWAVGYFASASPAMQFAATEIARAGWEARAALSTPDSTGEVEVTAYLHVLHMDCDSTCEEVTKTAKNPFGVRGKDYDPSYSVTTTPLYALAALPPSSGWEPIETVKDGQWVWLGNHANMRLGFWDKKGEWFVDLSKSEWGGGHRALHFTPTHWMPLPPPPSREGA